MDASTVSPPEKKASSAKKILSIVWNTFLWIFVVFAVIVTILAFAAQSSPDGVPSIAGKCILTVQTASMEPTFDAGDIIICDKITSEEEAKSLKVGDIISFDAGDLDGDRRRDINSHRIVDIEYDADGNPKYVTRGDNKAIVVEDASRVAPKAVICIWNGLRLKKIGNLLNFLQQPKGFLVCIVLPLALFFFYELFLFIRKFMEVKNAGKKQITEADEVLIRQKAVEEYIRQQQEAAAKAAAAEAESKAAEEAIASSPEKIEETKEKLNEAAEKVEDKVEAAAEKIEETVDSAVGKAEETVKEKIEETAAKAEETVKETIEEAKETIKDTAKEEENK